MNHIYRTVFNVCLGVMQVASELTRGMGKTRGRSALSRPLGAASQALPQWRPALLALSLSLLLSAPMPGWTIQLQGGGNGGNSLNSAGGQGGIAGGGGGSGQNTVSTPDNGGGGDGATTAAGGDDGHDYSGEGFHTGGAGGAGLAGGGGGGASGTWNGVAGGTGTTLSLGSGESATNILYQGSSGAGLTEGNSGTGGGGGALVLTGAADGTKFIINNNITGGAGGTSSAGAGGGGAGLVTMLTGLGSTVTNNKIITGGAGGRTGNITTPGYVAAGGGGAGVVVVSGTFSNTSAGKVTGGAAGSNGGSVYATDGDGIISAGTLTNAGTITGGAANASNSSTGIGGNGVTTNNQLTNSGTIQGGEGQTSGGIGVKVLSGGSNFTVTNSGTIAGGYAYKVAESGAGMVIAADDEVIAGMGTTVINTGTIRNGGANSTASVIGVLIQSDNNTLTNSGNITGGLSNGTALDISGNNNTLTNSGKLTSGANNGYALKVSGDNNMVNLLQGYQFSGKVISSGDNNILALDGESDSMLDVSRVATSTSNNFAKYIKTKTSTWTLNGIALGLTPWTIKQGTLAISDDKSLGDLGSDLTIQDGALQTLSTLTTERGINLTHSNSAFDVENGDLTLNGIINGDGALNKTGAGSLILSGTNQYSGGTTVNAGTLAISRNENLGADSGALTLANGTTLHTTGNVTGNRSTRLTSGIATFNVNGGTTLSMEGVISGDAALTKMGTGTLTLRATNSYQGNTQVAAGNITALANNALSSAALTIAEGASATFGANAGSIISQKLGTVSNNGQININAATVDSDSMTSDGIINIAKLGTLNLTNGGTFDQADRITGAGTLKLSGGELTFSEANNTFSGLTSIGNGTSITLNQGGNLGTSAYFIDADGLLNLNNHTGFTPNLTGTGTLNVNHSTVGTAFKFGAPTATSGKFAGTVNIQNVNVALEGDNTKALTQATLKMSTGSQTTVGNEEQNIGTLAFNGGTLVYNNIFGNTTDGLISLGTINANTIDTSGGGAVRVNMPKIATPGVDDLPVMELDEGEVIITLAKGEVAGRRGELVLQDKDGTTITDLQERGLQNDGSLDIVANALFDYNLNTGSESDGLYVTYGLSAVQLLMKDANALILNALTNDITAPQNDLKARITGEGDLALASATGNTITLAGFGSDYLGATWLRSGNLRLKTNNALGNTRLLNMAANTQTDLDGTEQTVGQLLTETGSMLDFNGGTLTLNSSTDNLVSTVNGTLTGTGNLVLNRGALTVTQANSGFYGSTRINTTASATLEKAKGLGSSAIEVLGTLTLNGDDAEFSNKLSGDGTINTNAKITLSGENSFSGLHEIGAAGILTVASAASLAGTAQVNLMGEASTLALSGYSGDVANQVTGNGNLQFINKTDATVTAPSGIADSVKVNITDATLNLKNIANFNHQLSGDGALNIRGENPDSNFAFGGTVGSEFTGTVTVENTTFKLGEANTVTLSQATLQLDNTSTTSVDDGEQNIGALVINGGRLRFENINGTDVGTTSKGTITTETIDVSKSGNIEVNYPDNPAIPENNEPSVLRLDDTGVHMRLATGQATGSGGNLVLTDMVGGQLPEDQDRYFSNGDDKPNSAIGTLGFRMTTGLEKDGLFVNYGLKVLELLNDDDQAFIVAARSSESTDAGRDLSAQVTGRGGIIFESDTNITASLSNLDNDYTGATWVKTGNLRLDNDGTLGTTRLLDTQSGTKVDLNGHTQSIGAVNIASGSTLDFNKGSLTLSAGGDAAGILTGAGTLVLTGGTLNINQANNGLSVTTDIQTNAIAHLTQVQGLGNGAITNNGTLNLDGANGTLANTLSGTTGQVTLTKSAVVQLTGDNSAYAGAFSTESGSRLGATQATQLGSASVANDGTLTLATDTTWNLTNVISGSGTLTKLGSGTLVVSGDNVTAGMTVVEDGVLRLGALPTVLTAAAKSVTSALSSVAALAETSPVLNSSVTLNAGTEFQGKGTVNGNFNNNNGTITLPHASGLDYGNLTITGNYNSNGGKVIVDTVLGDDDSLSDKLVITGNSTGNSRVIVNNIGGAGAETREGIKIIDVGNNSISTGIFVLDNRPAAGAYDYSLVQGGLSTPNDGDWYLRSIAATLSDSLRPESGSYGSNMAAGNTLFSGSLLSGITSGMFSGGTGDINSATGDSQYADAQTGEVKSTSLWVRMFGSHNRSQDESGKVKTQDNRYVTMLGTDVARWSITPQDILRVGIMAGYANSSSSTTSQGTGYTSKGKVDGYSVGVYGAWFANARDNRGAYIDGSLQYSWFDNEVNGQELAPVSYNSKGFTASVGTGYAFPIGGSGTHAYFIQPQAQLTWMGVEADDVIETNGTRVTGVGNNNIQTRLGVKAYAHPTQAVPSTGAMFRPFVQTSWIRNSKDFGTEMDGVVVKQGGSKNLAEVKMGLDGQINQQWSVSGNFGLQTGGSGYYNTSVVLGTTYKF